MQMLALSGKMKRKLLILFVCAGYIAVGTCESDISLPQDTYVDALQKSHGIEYDANGGSGYQYNPPPDNNYLPPANNYLPPANSYLPPANNYLPPDNSYLPPAPAPPVYGPPPPVYYRPSHPIPYHTHDSLLDKLKSKISLFTIGKLVLKLLIFKKIVKFIGVIFLLLILPKLKNMFSESMPMEDEGMSSKHEETDKDKLQKHIDEVYDFIMNSIESFEDENT